MNMGAVLMIIGTFITSFALGCIVGYFLGVITMRELIRQLTDRFLDKNA